jgi:hypothetical protein
MDSGAVVVGIIDTGIQTLSEGSARMAAHVRLQSHVVVHAGWSVTATDPKDAVDEDLVDGDGDGFVDRCAGHGTFIAGIIRRLAPGAQIVSQGGLSSFGAGDDYRLSQAIDDMLNTDPRPQIINMSFGGFTEDNDQPMAMRAILSKAFTGSDGVYGSADDIVVVASAGNDGSCRPTWPAAFADVIAVGALDLSGFKAGFSNWGHWVDAVAPGVDVVSTYLTFDAQPQAPQMIDADGDGVIDDPVAPEYLDPLSYNGWAMWSGTSFASPKVAAAIAREIMATGVSPRVAAHRIVHDYGLARMPNVGTVVNLL